MSDKRHRQQQRRQPRKAQGAARPRSRDNSTARLLAEAARLIVASIPDVTNAFEGEQLASGLIGTWRQRALPGDDADAVLFPGLVQALEAIGTEPA